MTTMSAHGAVADVDDEDNEEGEEEEVAVADMTSSNGANAEREQVTKLRKEIAAEESQIAALSKLILFYATDPAGQKIAMDQLHQAQENVSKLKESLAVFSGR
ncbi:hypothetical protein Pelo_16064 [Pelomyxa schiedti]|nr:hypothetical protein Pelo_16064 [Pelomyxa schiedti]